MNSSKEDKKITINFRPELFWDVDPKTIDPDKHARYIIERVLELGDISDVKWVTRYYPINLIRSILGESRVIGNKSRNLWSMVI